MIMWIIIRMVSEENERMTQGMMDPETMVDQSMVDHEWLDNHLVVEEWIGAEPELVENQTCVDGHETTPEEWSGCCQFTLTMAFLTEHVQESTWRCRSRGKESGWWR